MKKLTIICLISTFYLLYSTLLPCPAYAQTSTTSASLQQKIDALKKEVASKAAVLKLEVNKKLQNKIAAGTILDKSDKSLTISTKNGSRTVLINEYTDYQNNPKSGKKGLAKDDFIIALGDIDDKNNLAAKRVIKTNQPDSEQNQLVWGQVQAVNGSIITIKTKDSKKVQILVNQDTDFQLGNQEGSILDVKINRFLIATGIQTESGLKNTKLVYLIPTVGFFKPEKPKISTKSATPSATPIKK